jgi:hypothetical protein
MQGGWRGVSGDLLAQAFDASVQAVGVFTQGVHRAQKLLSRMARRQHLRFLLKIFGAVMQQGVARPLAPVPKTAQKLAGLMGGGVANHFGKLLFPVNIQMGQRGLEFGTDRRIAFNGDRPVGRTLTAPLSRQRQRRTPDMNRRFTVAAILDLDAAARRAWVSGSSRNRALNAVSRPAARTAGVVMRGILRICSRDAPRRCRRPD